MNKKRVLKERKLNKKIAWKIYSESPNATIEEKAILKSRFTSVSKKNTDDVKIIMDKHNVHYVTAPHEADELCARFVANNLVHACVSDDMDMLVYGCNKVIRDLDIESKSAMLYNLNDILISLKLSIRDFKLMCVLSGSDYYDSKFNVFESMSMYKQFKKSKDPDFYTWIHKNTAIQFDEFLIAYEMYNILNEEFDYLKSYCFRPESASESGDSCTSEG
jgi:5'-3' exonuclease